MKLLPLLLALVLFAAVVHAQDEGSSSTSSDSSSSQSASPADNQIAMLAENPVTTFSTLTASDLGNPAVKDKVLDALNGEHGLEMMQANPALMNEMFGGEAGVALMKDNPDMAKKFFEQSGAPYPGAVLANYLKSWDPPMTLNNAGDGTSTIKVSGKELIQTNPDGTEISSGDLSKCAEGTSIEFKDGQWQVVVPGASDADAIRLPAPASGVPPLSFATEFDPVSGKNVLAVTTPDGNSLANIQPGSIKEVTGLTLSEDGSFVIGMKDSAGKEISFTAATPEAGSIAPLRAVKADGQTVFIVPGNDRSGIIPTVAIQEFGRSYSFQPTATSSMAVTLTPSGSVAEGTDYVAQLTKGDTVQKITSYSESKTYVGLNVPETGNAITDAGVRVAGWANAERSVPGQPTTIVNNMDGFIAHIEPIENGLSKASFTLAPGMTSERKSQLISNSVERLGYAGSAGPISELTIVPDPNSDAPKAMIAGDQVIELPLIDTYEQAGKTMSVIAANTPVVAPVGVVAGDGTVTPGATTRSDIAAMQGNIKDAEASTVAASLATSAPATKVTTGTTALPGSTVMDFTLNPSVSSLQGVTPASNKAPAPDIPTSLDDLVGDMMGTTTTTPSATGTTQTATQEINSKTNLLSDLGTMSNDPAIPRAKLEAASTAAGIDPGWIDNPSLLAQQDSAALQKLRDAISPPVASAPSPPSGAAKTPDIGKAQDSSATITPAQRAALDTLKQQVAAATEKATAINAQIDRLNAAIADEMPRKSWDRESESAIEQWQSDVKDLERQKAQLATTTFGQPFQAALQGLGPVLSKEVWGTDAVSGQAITANTPPDQWKALVKQQNVAGNDWNIALARAGLVDKDISTFTAAQIAQVQGIHDQLLAANAAAATGSSATAPAAAATSGQTSSGSTLLAQQQQLILQGAKASDPAMMEAIANAGLNPDAVKQSGTIPADKVPAVVQAYNVIRARTAPATAAATPTKK